ncbi:hypothetical protein D3C80_1518310 [compost metagenome]
MSDRIHEDLIVSIQVGVVSRIRIAVIAVKHLVHRLKNKPFVIANKLIGNLLPHKLVFLFDGCLIAAVHQQPAALNGIVSVPVNINDHVQPFVISIIDNRLHPVQPSRIYRIVRCASNVTQV